MGPTETTFFWISLALYSAAWLTLLVESIFRKKIAGTFWLWLLALGLLAHTSSGLARWNATGHGPVMKDFENAIAGAWVIVAITFILICKRREYRPLATAALPMSLLLMGYGLTCAPELEPLSPVLKTPWMYIHVIFAWISFGALTAASCGSALFLIKEKQHRLLPPGKAKTEQALTALRNLDELQFRLVTYGFVAAAVMIASGSIWARLLWGSYWGWDPVETWSLASWIVYGLYIHLRVVFRWQMRRAAWLCLFAILPVFVSFWGVGFMLSSRHLFNVMDMLNK